MSKGQLFIIGFLIFTSLLVSCSSTKISAGKVYVIGNDPFFHLAFETDQHTMQVISERSPVYKKLWKIQTELIEINYEVIDGELYVTKFKKLE